MFTLVSYLGIFQTTAQGSRTQTKAGRKADQMRGDSEEISTQGV